ncbi:hypothetical protein LZ575_12635 [Antarcticibacterium sp. 1MA-6-2]|uniref:hypothetical protein n=1 Tax=Antarcticibacterium sp. 1MA-6-2 TaxID=2908210 RepID=UPI001F367B4B|nr:hypothetical protein [Antarcticibacterium sp. 1MA-6-2]UJH89846.1 hypothetical protein LZ575_12635 [Antarcticibacterium sp. 1MA-6-2]
MGIINNNFTTHHIGIGGEFFNYFVSYPYKLMFTYGNNYGRYHTPYEPKQEVGYIYSELGVLRKYLNLDVQLGAEFNSVQSPIFGVGIQLSKTF